MGCKTDIKISESLRTSDSPLAPSCTDLSSSVPTSFNFGSKLGLETTFLLSSISVLDQAGSELRSRDGKAPAPPLSDGLSPMASTCFQISSICVRLASLVCSMDRCRRLREADTSLAVLLLDSCWGSTTAAGGGEALQTQGLPVESERSVSEYVDSMERVCDLESRGRVSGRLVLRFAEYCRAALAPAWIFATLFCRSTSRDFCFSLSQSGPAGAPLEGKREEEEEGEREE